MPSLTSPTTGTSGNNGPGFARSVLERSSGALFRDHVPVAPVFASWTPSALIAEWTSNVKINGTYINRRK